MTTEAHLKLALQKAIAYLREYAAEDEATGGSGCGCFCDPTFRTELWIREIIKISKGE